MTRRILEVDDPPWLAILAVDLDDERSYLLRAPDHDTMRALLLGAEQVAMLADRLSAMLDELERNGLVAIDTGNGADHAAEGGSGEVFVGHTLLVGWDEERGRFTLEAWAATDAGGAGDSAYGVDEVIDVDITDDDPDGPDVLRIRITPRLAQRLARHAFTTLASDRSDCPLCGQPISPTRHRCPPIEDAARDD